MQFEAELFSQLFNGTKGAGGRIKLLDRSLLRAKSGMITPALDEDREEQLAEQTVDTA